MWLEFENFALCINMELKNNNKNDDGNLQKQRLLWALFEMLQLRAMPSLVVLQHTGPNKHIPISWSETETSCPA